MIAHLGGHDNGALMAFDAASGEVLWRWAEDGPGYASPVVASFDGVSQVITQTQSFCVGLDRNSGRLLWKIPFTTPYDQNVITPVLSGDTVIFSGLEQGTFAVRPTIADGSWIAKSVWRNADISMYMSSPVLADSLLFGFARNQKGSYVCLDARTSKTLWSSEGRQGDYAVLMQAESLVLGQTAGSELLILEKSAQDFRPLARYTVAASPTWAAPVPLDGHVLVKDVDSLILWRIEAEE